MKKISFAKILIRLLPMAFVASPILFISISAVGIIHGASIGFMTFITQHFFDSVTQAVNGVLGYGSVLWMTLALGAVAIGQEIINGIHNFMGNTFIKKANGFVSVRLNQKAASIEPISFEDPNLLDDINKANEGMSNSFGLLFAVLTLVTFYFPYFLFMGIYLYTLKPILAFSLVLIFIPVVINQLIKGVVFAKLEDQAAPLRREFEYYECCICDREYFKETRILGAARFFHELYQSTLKLFGKKKWEAEFKTGLMELGMKMMTLAGYFGVLYLLFSALLNGEISIGAFAAVFASIGLMFNIMEEIISRHIGSMTVNLGTVRNFIRFLDLPEREGEELAIDAGNGIVLAHVTFRYPGAQFDSLLDITFEVKKGETIAIVGENGAGKTTLTQLMTGLYLPTEGSVFIDRVDTKKISGKSIYKGISAVFQKYQRYKMSLEDNIGISDIQTHNKAKGKHDKRIEIASEKADLTINKLNLPHGYQTMLSREFDGVDLSGGQWQRIAIARGFYRANNMIVLDEPTAAIDPLEETKIYEKFAEISEGKTSIIVTHRLGSAKIADRIIVMDHGRIAEIGTHEELIQLSGKYTKMYTAQAQWYIVQN